MSYYKQINKLQDTINQLNDAIFKDPRNRQRPPSEYLEVFNKLTEKLHSTQQELERLELHLNASNFEYSTTTTQDEDEYSHNPIASPKSPNADKGSRERCHVSTTPPRINIEHLPVSLLRIWYYSSSIGNGTFVIEK